MTKELSLKCKEECARPENTELYARLSAEVPAERREELNIRDIQNIRELTIADVRALLNVDVFASRREELWGQFFGKQAQSLPERFRREVVMRGTKREVMGEIDSIQDDTINDLKHGKIPQFSTWVRIADDLGISREEALALWREDHPKYLEEKKGMTRSAALINSLMSAHPVAPLTEWAVKGNRPLAFPRELISDGNLQRIITAFHKGKRVTEWHLVDRMLYALQADHRRRLQTLNAWLLEKNLPSDRQMKPKMNRTDKKGGKGLRGFGGRKLKEKEDVLTNDKVDPFDPGLSYPEELVNTADEQRWVHALQDFVLKEELGSKVQISPVIASSTKKIRKTIRAAMRMDREAVREKKTIQSDLARVAPQVVQKSKKVEMPPPELDEPATSSPEIVDAPIEEISVSPEVTSVVAEEELDDSLCRPQDTSALEAMILDDDEVIPDEAVVEGDEHEVTASRFSMDFDPVNPPRNFKKDERKKSAPSPKREPAVLKVDDATRERIAQIDFSRIEKFEDLPDYLVITALLTPQQKSDLCQAVEEIVDDRKWARGEQTDTKRLMVLRRIGISLTEYRELQLADAEQSPAVSLRPYNGDLKKVVSEKSINEEKEEPVESVTSTLNKRRRKELKRMAKKITQEEFIQLTREEKDIICTKRSNLGLISVPTE
jgi:hypothetical protein